MTIETLWRHTVSFKEIVDFVVDYGRKSYEWQEDGIDTIKYVFESGDYSIDIDVCIYSSTDNVHMDIYLFDKREIINCGKFYCSNGLDLEQEAKNIFDLVETVNAKGLIG